MNDVFKKYVLPLLYDFQSVRIYNYEIAKIDQQTAKLANKKNIHSALDLPDFKVLRRVRLINEILRLSCEKLNLGNEIIIKKKTTNKYIFIDGIEYCLLIFALGEKPIFKYSTDENIIVFIYNYNFTKIFYCGKKKISKSDFLDDFFFNFSLLTYKL